MTTHLAQRTEEIFHADLSKIRLWTDRMFFWLLIGQWLFGIAVAVIWSPRTWIAQYWSIHQHVIAATVLGALFEGYPLYLIIRKPGSRYTRHMIAIGQMLQSALLVHITGGRIETHFHVFGSLALLSFYRDWRVLITGTIVVFVDHLALGAWFPLSVYGVPAATIWRSLEHAGWVIFEVVFLTMACRTGIRDSRAMAGREAALEQSNTTLELRVEERTTELQRAKSSLEEEVRERTKALAAAKGGLEVEVANRTQELAAAKEVLEEKVGQLQALNEIMMGREERILEMKEAVKAFEAQIAAQSPVSEDRQS